MSLVAGVFNAGFAGGEEAFLDAGLSGRARTSFSRHFPFSPSNHSEAYLGRHRTTIGDHLRENQLKGGEGSTFGYLECAPMREM